jgi:uncharacterized protein YcbK (DUF882 family)
MRLPRTGRPEAKGNALRADGSAPPTFIGNRILVRVGSVGLAAVLLASCSTSSDPFSQLGLVAQPADQPLAEKPAAEMAQAPNGGNYFIVSDDDPELPEEVAYRPALANGDEPVAYTSDATAQSAPVEIAAADAARVDDPVLAARMGANGVYLEAVPGQQQTVTATAPAPQQPKRRGFFASLFTAPREEQPQSQRPVARAQPPVEPAAEQVEQAAAPENMSPEAAADETEQVALAAAEPAQAVDTQTPQPTAYVENRPPEAEARPAPRKRGFLSSLFSSPEQQPQAQQRGTQPVIKFASVAPGASASGANFYGRDALPGVRDTDSLYEIKRKSGTDDDSDIDINEGDGYQVAMAPGLARLAPNGLLVQTDKVDVACLKPSLVRVLKSIEGHYGEKVVVTSGYRSPPHNQRARGARNSLHMYCAAVDIQVPGVDKWELATYLRSMPGRGGVGTYCHTNSVHVDVGPERDWNWRCRRRRK